MTGGNVCLSAVVGVVLIGMTMAAIPGPKDPRYPDYIVDPKVRCYQEGSFHHPRNCSWYYRCVDRMNVGYFWTYYFECEPGTVFSDELDQCVHPHLAEAPCGTPTPPPPPTPTPKPPALVCEGVEGTCQTLDICRPVKQEKVFCKEIRCNLRSSNLRCSEGKMFDMDTKECVFPPSGSQLCESFPCRGVPGTCTTYNICRPKKEEKEFCKKVICNLRSSPLECPAGQEFEMSARECRVPPNAADLCGASTNITVVEPQEINCSYENLRPYSDFISRLYCTSIPLCDAGRYKGKIELCDKYYECYREGAQWKAALRSCPLGLLYNYQTDRCELEPTEAEKC